MRLIRFSSRFSRIYIYIGLAPPPGVRAALGLGRLLAATGLGRGLVPPATALGGLRGSRLVGSCAAGTAGAAVVRAGVGRAGRVGPVTGAGAAGRGHGLAVREVERVLAVFRQSDIGLTVEHVLQLEGGAFVVADPDPLLARIAFLTVLDRWHDRLRQRVLEPALRDRVRGEVQHLRLAHGGLDFG